MAAASTTFAMPLPRSRLCTPTSRFMSRKQGVVLCSLQKTLLTEDRDGCKSTKRREAMLKMALYLGTTAVSLPALADGVDDAPADFRVYSDDVNKFKISIPQDWQVGAGESDGIKSITAFFPQGASTSNVSVAITGIGPDFTRLESFGKVDAFAESLVNGLDRSWQRPPGIAAKLIDCKAANGLYYLEYTLQKPGENRRHIYSAIGMANNGWYNRLYTVTGQFVEEESDKFGSTIEKAVQSFTLG